VVLGWATEVLVLRHKIADYIVFPVGLKEGWIAA